MKIKHQRNYLTEEANLISDNIAESRAITASGGGDFMGSNALSRAHARAAQAVAWMNRHPEAKASARPVRVEARSYNLLAQALLRRGAHISDVRHMVTY